MIRYVDGVLLGLARLRHLLHHIVGAAVHRCLLEDVVAQRHLEGYDAIRSDQKDMMRSDQIRRIRCDQIGSDRIGSDRIG